MFFKKERVVSDPTCKRTVGDKRSKPLQHQNHTFTKMENNSSRKRQLTSNSNKVGVTNAKKLKKKKNQEMAVLPASSTPAKELNASNSQNMDSFSSINMTPRHLLVTDAIAVYLLKEILI